MPRGRVAPELQKTPSRTKIFSIDMADKGQRPESAISTIGINPSLRSNTTNTQEDTPASPSSETESAFTTTIPIFRGANSGQLPPIHPNTKLSKKDRNEDEDMEHDDEQDSIGKGNVEDKLIPKFSVRSPDDDDARSDRLDFLMDEPSALPRRQSGESGVLQLVNMATNPGNANPALPDMKAAEEAEALNLTLHQCARDGDEYNMNILLRNIPDHQMHRKINHKDEDDLTPLHYAARYNHLNVVKLLVENGADTQARGEDDVTPLHHASRYRREKTKKKELSPELAALEDDELGSGVPPSLVESPENTIVHYLVTHGANINAVDIYGQTALHFAAMRGNETACFDLLSFKDSIDIQSADNQGITPLHCAALHNQLEIADELIKAGADIMCRDKELSTPLHHACLEGNLSFVQMLFDAGARSKASWVKVTDMVVAQDAELSTALHHAVENSHYDVVKLLLEKRAEVNRPRKGFVYPLHLAAQSGDLRICRLLVENQARIDAANSDQATPLHRAAALNKSDIIRFLVDRGARINRRDKDNYTPLLLAATYGNCESVEVLLQKGADYNVQDKYDKTAIFMAAEENQLSTLRILLADPRVKQLVNESDCYDNSPLHIAAQRGYLEVVQCLLENGADLDDKNEEEETPLHLAAKCGRTNIVRELIKTDTTIVNDEDENSNTALHLAASHGHHKVVKLLLDLGADVSARNYTQWTPLDLAASKGWTKTCSVLLIEDAPVDPIDKNKTTPLHLAASNGHDRVVHLLLEWDADVTLRDDWGRNCLGRAVENHHVNVAMTLVNSDVWKDALRNAYTDKNTGYVMTPMRRLIKKMPEVALRVFDRCLSYGQEKNPESLSYEITFDYEFIEDVFARWITKGVQRMESDTAGSDSDTASSYSTEDDALALLPDAQPYTKDTSIQKKNHPLNIMIQNEREDLLAHPLVTSLLQHKWNALGSFVYYLTFWIYVVFLSFLTGYMVVTDPPNKYGNDSSKIEDNDCSELSYKQDTFAAIGTYVIIVLAILNLFKELVQLYQAKLGYFGWTNLVEWIVYVAALLLVISFNECQRETGYRYTWQWHIGAIAVFLAWLDLVLFIQKFPRFGIYVVMFTDVLHTFTQFFVVFFLFVVAFALAFFALFQNQTPFSTVPKSFIKTSVMMIGEFEFDTIFNDVDNKVHYPAASYIIFVIFMVLMSIILMNLLVGLAVDDIKVVQEKAGLKRMAMQVDLALDVERIIPDFLRRRAYRQRQTIRPNQLFANPIFRLYSNSYLSPQALQQALNPDKEEVEKVREKQEKLVYQVKKLKSDCEEILESNQKLESMLKAIVKAKGVPWEEEDYQQAEDIDALGGSRNV